MQARAVASGEQTTLAVELSTSNTIYNTNSCDDARGTRYAIAPPWLNVEEMKIFASFGSCSENPGMISGFLLDNPIYIFYLPPSSDM